MAVVLLPRMQPSAAPVWWAYAVLVLGAACWAVSTVLFRRSQGTGPRQATADVVWVTALQAAYGAPVLLAAGLMLEGWRFQLTVDLVWSLAFTGLFASGLANLLWFFLLTKRTATVVSTYVFLVPAFAVGFGVLVLGEPLTPHLLGGGLLTLVGIMLVTRPPAERIEPPRRQARQARQARQEG
jgi:drug/metabolite transporter (DMT)-like permease